VEWFYECTGHLPQMGATLIATICKLAHRNTASPWLAPVQKVLPF